MELLFLGTCAGKPIRERNVASIVLQATNQIKDIWMFDCGEGTQHQLLKTSVKLNRLNKLFITHLHGDHVYGIPGLLSSRSSLGCAEPLHIYGPPGIREFVEANLRITQTYLAYKLNISEISEGLVVDDAWIKVVAAKLDHRIECYGYRLEEKERPGSLNTGWLASKGLAPGPVYGRLKAGHDITLEDGTVIRSAQAIGKPIPGRTITIIGDTRPCSAAISLSLNADVLIHEATFAHALVDKAFEFGHCTALQAAQIAKAANVKKLYITHFSSRYKQDEIAELEAEARTVYSETEAAVELKSYFI